MRHQKSGRKLKRTSSHKKALMRNLATAIITHKKIATTEAKAKELRPYIEKLITRAKKALVREQQNKLPEGQKIDVHARRMVSADVFGKGAVQELFDVIAPKVAERAGGYCRIIKTGVRTGDAARTAVIQLVDWYDVQDGAVSTKRKRKPAAKPKAKTEPIEGSPAAPAPEAKKPAKKKATPKTAIPAEEPANEVVEEIAVPVEEPLAEVVEEETAPVIEEPIAEVSEEVEEIIPSDEEESVKIKKSEE